MVFNLLESIIVIFLATEICITAIAQVKPRGQDRVRVRFRSGVRFILELNLGVVYGVFGLKTKA